MGGLLTPPAVGETYGGGTVTRRQISPQGQIRLLVDGQWLIFEPSPPTFKPGDIEPPAPLPPPPPPVTPEPVGFERLIGKQVEYEGRTYTLLDYLPACGYCQISGHGETKCVPENQVRGEV